MKQWMLLRTISKQASATERDWLLVEGLECASNENGDIFVDVETIYEREQDGLVIPDWLNKLETAAQQEQAVFLYIHP